jgi:protein-disulfide isomerase
MPNARQAKSAREKAAELRAEAERKAARNRVMIAGSLALVVVLVIVGVTVLFRTLQKQQDDKVAAQSAPPANLYTPTDQKKNVAGFLVGPGTAKVTVEMYEDFQCPVCKQAHQANDAQLDQWVKDGKVKVVYQPIAFLDRASTDGYSTRSLNAAAAVIDLHPAGFEAFQKSLYDNQPAENGAGLTDQQLIDYAVAAGAPKAQVTTDVTSRRFAGWVKDVTDESSKRGVTGTPTIKVNGKALSDWQPAKFKAAVEAALKG